MILAAHFGMKLFRNNKQTTHRHISDLKHSKPNISRMKQGNRPTRPPRGADVFRAGRNHWRAVNSKIDPRKEHSIKLLMIISFD